MDQLDHIGLVHGQRLQFYREHRFKMRLPNLLCEIYEIENGANGGPGLFVAADSQKTAHVKEDGPDLVGQQQQQSQQYLQQHHARLAADPSNSTNSDSGTQVLKCEHLIFCEVPKYVLDYLSVCDIFMN